MIDEHSDDASLVYLRGRLEPRADAALEFCDRAIAIDPRNGFAWGAKAYHLHATGRFAEGLAAVETALELQPERYGLFNMHEDLRLAMKRFDELEQAARDLTAEDWAPGAELEVMTIRAAKGDLPGAQLAQQAFAEAIQAEWPEDPFSLVHRSELDLLYYQGDLKSILRRVKEPGYELFADHYGVCANLELGRPDAIGGFSDTPPDDEGFIALATSLACDAIGDEPNASRYRQIAIQAMKSGSAEAAYAGMLLEQCEEQSVVPDDALHISLVPGHKMLVLLALADAAPVDQRSKLLSLAEELNYAPDFPQRFVKQHITRLRGPGAAASKHAEAPTAP